MPRRIAPENFFRNTGLPTIMRKNQPLVRGRILGGKCAREPPPGSAAKHCRFLDTGGGGGGASANTPLPSLYKVPATPPTFSGSPIKEGQYQK